MTCNARLDLKHVVCSLSECLLHGHNWHCRSLGPLGHSQCAFYTSHSLSWAQPLTSWARCGPVSPSAIRGISATHNLASPSLSDLLVLQVVLLVSVAPHRFLVDILWDIHISMLASLTLKLAQLVGPPSEFWSFDPNFEQGPEMMLGQAACDTKGVPLDQTPYASVWRAPLRGTWDLPTLCFGTICNSYGPPVQAGAFEVEGPTCCRH